MSGYEFVEYVNGVKGTDHFGIFIKKVRTKLNLKQMGFSKMVGVKRDNLRLIERGIKSADERLKNKVIKLNDYFTKK